MNNLSEHRLVCFNFEKLGGGFGVYISEEHGFGTDALLLAHFSNPRKNDIACDFGSGCGIIPMIWCRDGLCSKITAVEISKSACSQLEMSVKETDTSEKIDVLNSDLKDLKGKLKFNSFNLVTMNPPYKAINTGKQSTNQEELVARHEIMCGLDDVTHSASRLLKFGGRLCLCHRPERLCDIFSSMRSANIEPKRMRFVSAYQGKAPWLVLVEGRLGGKSGLTVEPTLYRNDTDGNETEEFIEFYGEYRNQE